ncbi:MAG TPA: hypothetical protein V6C58_25325, partial [Allocoleopsis sp.]
VSEAIISAIMDDLITRNQVSVRGFKLIKNRVYTFARGLLGLLGLVTFIFFFPEKKICFKH